MKKPELLSPAGNMECLKAAIQGGCDAVYLGGYVFGARSFAGNFSNEEIIEAVCYAHLYGVKIYVTVNTLVYEDETDMFLEYIDFLYKNNVDAIIIQDIGMMDLIRKTYPDFEIHASTQMHIHNLQGVKAAQKLGITRVVLARETDIKTIQNIQKNTNIEIEIFVHGALCFCYSGQCLMSSMLGGRSGNRGTCSQCCRMPYNLYFQNKKINHDNYILSPKDLNSLNYIGDLIEIGVDSLKIEGRMKRPEYVYYVTKLYRKAIDSYCKNQTITITEKETDTLKKLFHREFTKGFLFQENQKNWLNPKRPNHIGIKIGKVVSNRNGWVTCQLTYPIHQNDGIRILGKYEDNGCILNKIYQNGKLVNSGKKGDTISFFLKGKFLKSDILVLTSDSRELAQIQNTIKSNKRKVAIQGKLKCRIGNPIQYQITDLKNQVTVTSHTIVEKACKMPITKERIEMQLQKLGDTVYQLENLQMDLDANIFISIQELNQIRRDAISKLNQKRLYQRVYHKEKYDIELNEEIEKFGYTIHIHSLENYKKFSYLPFKQIYIEDKNLYEQLKNDDRVVLSLPRVMTHFPEIKGKIMGSELGSIFNYKPYYSNFSLNVTNAYTVAFLHTTGIKRVTLSLELSESQIQELMIQYKNRYHKKPNLEIFITQYPEVMISKFDILNYYHVFSPMQMRDSKNHHFRIEKSNNYTKIYYEKHDNHLNLSFIKNIGISTVCLSDLDSNIESYFINDI